MTRWRCVTQSVQFRKQMHQVTSSSALAVVFESSLPLKIEDPTRRYRELRLRRRFGADTFGMQAQIRTATRKECLGFCRAKVCVYGDQLAYLFEPWSLRVTDMRSQGVYLPTRKNGVLTYQLSENQSLSVVQEDGRWVFNGEPLKEHWPTSFRRELIAGRYVIKIRPEDDTFIFDVVDWPKLDEALIGFFASIPIAGD